MQDAVLYWVLIIINIYTFSISGCKIYSCDGSLAHV